MTQLARDTGASGMAFEAARSSGAPYPRLVDLPGATIVCDAELRTYLESDEALTSRDFPLEWAVGVLRASEDLFRVPRLHSSESQSRVHGVVLSVGVLRASEDLFRVPRLHSSESQSRDHGVVRP